MGFKNVENVTYEINCLKWKLHFFFFFFVLLRPIQYTSDENVV